jgi:hypothetical protein
MSQAIGVGVIRMPEAAKKPFVNTDISEGDLVFITTAGHEWLTRKDKFRRGGMVLAGRAAKVLTVYDWETEHGKAILEKREATEKWVGLESRDFRYVLLLMFPEIPSDGRQGIALPEVLPLMMPREDKPTPLFAKYPEHLKALMDHVGSFPKGDGDVG